MFLISNTTCILLQESFDYATADWGIKTMALCPTYIQTKLLVPLGSQGLEKVDISAATPQECAQLNIDFMKQIGIIS